MNSIIRLFVLCLNILALTACNDAITRFWNGPGWDLYPKQSKAYDECNEELRYLVLPKEKMLDEKIYKEWSVNIYDPQHDECMRRKGFGSKPR
jgi:lipoprotein